MDQINIRFGTIAEARACELAVLGRASDEKEYVDRGARVVVGCSNNQVVSFLVTYIRDGRIYIWLCGSDPNIRGRGYLSQMLRKVLPTYEEEDVFVKTYPKFYSTMYNWISKRGFKFEGEEERNHHTERGPFVRYGTSKKDLMAKL
jgi:hypothetical protein